MASWEFESPILRQEKPLIYSRSDQNLCGNGQFTLTVLDHHHPRGQWTLPIENLADPVGIPAHLMYQVRSGK